MERRRARLTRAAAVLGAVAATVVLAPAARAADPLPLTGVSPADGATVPPTPTGGIAWQLTATAPPPDAMVSVTVATSPATGPDGTLPTDNRVDLFFLSQGAAPGAWTGRSDPGPNAWSADVGTFYWQAVATWTDAAGVFHSAASSIERLGVGMTPAPLPGTGSSGTTGGSGSTRTTLAMSSLDATFYVRTIIRRRTRRTPAGLHYACARRISRSFRCRPTWRDSRNRYTATATFTHVRSGGRIVARATVTGTRASRRCISARGLRRCRVPFSWHATLAPRPIGSGAAPGSGPPGSAPGGGPPGY